jgi:CRP-like cAMP-binding protein
MSESSTLPASSTSPALSDAAAVDLLRDSALFRGCTPDDLSDLARLGEPQGFAPGEDIITEGDAPRYVYLIQQGEVSVLKVSPVAGHHELVRLGAGAYFGELALLEMGARSATVRARTAVTVMAFPIASIVELSETRPHFARLVNGVSREVAARLRHSNDARIEALDRALEEEKTRAALGRLLVSLIGVYSLYNFLFSTATTVKAVLGHTEFASIPIIAFMTAIQVQFMRRSGYPARAFGLTLENWRRHAAQAVRFTVPLIAGVIAAKVALVSLVPAMHGQPVFDILAAGSRVNPWLVLAYLAFVPLQELIVRGSIQGALERSLLGEHRVRNAILASNAIFAAGHLHVSITLSLIVLVTGLFWGWLYSRQHSLVGVSVSHLLLGLTALEIVGFGVLE